MRLISDNFNFLIFLILKKSILSLKGIKFYSSNFIYIRGAISVSIAIYRRLLLTWRKRIEEIVYSLNFINDIFLELGLQILLEYLKYAEKLHAEKLQRNRWELE